MDPPDPMDTYNVAAQLIDEYLYDYLMDTGFLHPFEDSYEGFKCFLNRYDDIHPLVPGLQPLQVHEVRGRPADEAPNDVSGGLRALRTTMRACEMYRRRSPEFLTRLRTNDEEILPRE